jgi:hypothetical protein
MIGNPMLYIHLAVDTLCLALIGEALGLAARQVKSFLSQGMNDLIKLTKRRRGMGGQKETANI